MKVRIDLKDPDGVYDSLSRAVAEDVASVSGVSDDERDALEDTRRDTLVTKCEKWIKWKEYVSIEIDTDAGTATVLPVDGGPRA